MKFSKKTEASLYLILDLGILPANLCPSFMAQELVKSGVDIIQLRAKNASDDIILHRLEGLIPTALNNNCPIIVNDRVEVAAEFSAMMESYLSDFPKVKTIDGLWGIHLGQDDMDCKKAREFLGPKAIIGISVDNVAQGQKAKAAGADYIGYGSMFPTETKKDAQKASLEMAKKIRQNVDLPLYLIGGINSDNIDSLIENGFNKMAIAGGILRQKGQNKAANDLKSKLNKK